MHIIRLDIDRKNSAEHLCVGPLGNGLNAIFAPIQSAGDDMSRFVRNLLFRGYDAQQPDAEDFTQTVDGSMQWVDASGHVRMVSYSGGSPILPARFVHSPIHPSQRPIHSDDRDQIRGLGNIFWEGDDKDSRWDELRGDILGMVFCSPLGSVSPEKLWWAASRLGVHSPARSEMDEGYQRLKSEERELLDRLRHVDNVDHDRAWWSLERDRLASELTHVLQINARVAPVNNSDRDPHNNALHERLASIQIEISKLRNQLHELVIQEAHAKPEALRRDDNRASISGNSNRYSMGRFDYAGERQRIQTRIEHLLAEQANVEIQLRNGQNGNAKTSEPPRVWDDSQLRQQLEHADEMLRRWDRRAQTHRRLAEVQSHLRTRSPYRKTSEGSLIPTAERYLRELTSGAARLLPPWAVEASYLHHQDDFPEVACVATEGYRREYYDRSVPSSSTRQRKLVDLAIRLAIADAAVSRIGRVPLLLDDSISEFRGESLEQILHVLAGFARDGRQLLVTTVDEYTARRVAAHGGTVCRMQEILRYARPSYVLDSHNDLGIHPSLERSPVLGPYEVRPTRTLSMDDTYELSEINRQLVGLANEQANHSWWYPDSSKRVQRPIRAVDRSNSKRLGLFPDSHVYEIPGVDSELSHRFQNAGIYRVSDLMRCNPVRLADTIRTDGAVIQHLQQVAELMCGTPGLRPFDAEVLVGCGIQRSSQLRSFDASELVTRVEDFLASVMGQDLIRNASAFEVARIQNWIADIKRSLTNRENSSRHRNVDNGMPRDPQWESQRDRRHEFENRPRLARTESYEYDDSVRTNGARAKRETSFASRTSARGSSSKSSSQSNTGASSLWKFYLDVDSPVVDAPSIGPRMAERLNAFNVVTVGDLVAANATELAGRLADKNVSASTIEQWQQQALLVCRIPNLRGHDAQLLVGAGCTTAEHVAASNSTTLYEQVVRFASSKAGVRILRGAAVPDANEVANWIQWSQNCRAVRAA